MSAQNFHNHLISVLELEGQTLLQCAERLRAQPPTLTERCLSLMTQCLDRDGKLILTGVGKSGKIAEKIAATLTSTGNPAVFIHPTEALHGDLGIVQKNDAVIALSYTGNTEELLRLLPAIKKRGVPIIGMGGNSQSKLAQASDVWLDAWVAQEACPHNLAPTSSTTLMLALGDALATTLMKYRKLTPEVFAQNHPGGTLGKRLYWKVADWMHSGDALPKVTPESSFDRVLEESTSKRLGGVAVIDPTSGALRGLITDGDLRRALKHREKLFSLCAQDLMTATPISIRAGTSVQEALELMQNRTHPLNLLPVLEETGERCVGVVRIHDLVAD